MAEYIEREKVLDAIDKSSWPPDGSAIALCVYEVDLKDEIAQMPAADVAPVVHAHWIYSRQNVFGECSNCGAWYDVMQGQPNDGRLDYCPHCGAIMDEVSNER